MARGSGAPRIWFARECNYTADPRIGNIAAEFGAEGVLTMEEILALAKLENDAGRVAGRNVALGRRSFTPPKKVKGILALAGELGALEVESLNDSRFVVRIPRWSRWQVTDPSAAERKAVSRQSDTNVTEPERDISGTVTPLQEQEQRTPKGVHVETLCSLLSELVIANGTPEARVNPESTAWQTAARLLLERDGRDFDEAQRLIQWCQADDFWRSNVLSMPKFRAKYDQLRLQAKREPANLKAAPTRPTVDQGLVDAILTELGVDRDPSTTAIVEGLIQRTPENGFERTVESLVPYLRRKWFTEEEAA